MQVQSIGLVLVAVCACSGSAAAQTDSTSELIIRTYNVADVTRQSVMVAEAAAAQALRAAGIGIIWRRCGMTNGPISQSNDTCGDVLRPRELVIRMVVAPPRFADPDTLGYSFVDLSTQRGTLGTIFADRIRAFALEVRKEEGELLGLAIAHEVGHMLLGTDRHSQKGLMKGHWLPNDRLDSVFTAQQAVQMRVGLIARDPIHLVVAPKMGSDLESRQESR